MTTISETEMIRRFQDDWNYTRTERHTKKNITFNDASSIQYFIEEEDGKIIGYSGVGEYKDLIVDAGDYTLGGNATDRNIYPDSTAVNFRGRGIATSLREQRDNLGESMANAKSIPFIIVLKNNESRYLSNNTDYHLKHKGIPEWVRERLGDRHYYVYNPDEPDQIQQSFDKIWRGTITKMVNRGEHI